MNGDDQNAPPASVRHDSTRNSRGCEVCSSYNIKTSTGLLERLEVAKNAAGNCAASLQKAMNGEDVFWNQLTFTLMNDGTNQLFSSVIEYLLRYDS